jgi:hypothetical protein
MTELDGTSDDWSVWRIHVLKELQRQNDNIEALRNKIEENETKRLDEKTLTKIDITELQTKIWAICAGISVAIGVAMKFI